MYFFQEVPDNSVKDEVLSGLTVALALVPEAVAFAFVAGVEPNVGLYAAFIVGLVTAVLGGRPGMISGATGAMAVVMVTLVAEYGVQYLFATIMLTGLLQIAAGIFKLGKFIRMVPYPVMLGFVNGLAIVILLAQLKQFKIQAVSGTLVWLPVNQMTLMLSLVLLTMLIIYLLPNYTKAIPSSLAAIVLVTILVRMLNLETRTVVDFLRIVTDDSTATLAGTLPSFSFPAVPFNWDTLHIVLPYAVILAAIGLIESLLTLCVLDQMTNTRGRSNRECIAQGVANISCSLFGAMGGCAMIGQSMININSGGRGRLSGIIAASVLLCFILFASALIEMIPLAALVGVMFMVVISTFEWSTFRLARRVPKHDYFIILLVTFVTVVANLAIAVVVGVIVSALIFSWQQARDIAASSRTMHEGVKEYQIRGSLFFGSAKNFIELFDAHSDPNVVVVDFAQSRVADHSAIDAIEKLAKRYSSLDKTFRLRHLSPRCYKLLLKSGCHVQIDS